MKNISSRANHARQKKQKSITATQLTDKISKLHAEKKLTNEEITVISEFINVLLQAKSQAKED